MRKLTLTILLISGFSAGMAAQEVEIPREVRQQLRVANIPLHARLEAYIRHFNAPYLEDPDRRQTLMTDESKRLGLDFADMERFVAILNVFGSVHRVEANAPHREACELVNQERVFSSEEAQGIIGQIDSNLEIIKTAKAQEILAEITAEFGTSIARATEARLAEWAASMKNDAMPLAETVERLYGGDYYPYLKTRCGIFVPPAQ